MNDFIVKQLVGGMPDLERRLQWWADQFKFRISQAVGRLRAGKITLADFQQFGRDELRDTYYGIAETGIGRRLTRKEMAQIRTTVLKEQLGYWDRFCQAIADQRQALLDEGLEGAELEVAFNNLYDKFDRRAQSYAGAIEAEGTRWAMARLYKDKSWHQWKLREAEHCLTCLEREDTIAQMKDGRLPYYPKDGTTLCLYNCLCYWQPISRFKAMALRALGKLKRVFRRKSFGEMVDEIIEKHYGPGPHPGTGTPQSIHAGAKQRKGTPKGTHAAGALTGKDICDWTQTKPWERSKKEFANGEVKGFKYNPNLKAMASNRGGYITVGDSFFENDIEGRRATVYHEAGHDVSAKMLDTKGGGRGFELLEPFRIDTGAVSTHSRYNNFAGISSRPEEMLADVYSSLIFGLDDYEDKKYKKLFAGIKHTAKDLGYPAKHLFEFREGEWVEVGS